VIPRGVFGKPVERQPQGSELGVGKIGTTTAGTLVRPSFFAASTRPHLDDRFCRSTRIGGQTQTSARTGDLTDLAGRVRAGLSPSRPRPRIDLPDLQLSKNGTPSGLLITPITHPKRRYLNEQYEWIALTRRQGFSFTLKSGFGAAPFFGCFDARR